MRRILPLALCAAALVAAPSAANAQDRWRGGDHHWRHHDGDRHHYWRGRWYGGWGGGWGYGGGGYVSIGVYPYGYGYGGYYPSYVGYPYAYPIYGYPGYPTGYLRYDYGGRRDWDRHRRWRSDCDRDDHRRC
jgi:Ni/Co efflux regulator RcnB